MRAQLTAVAAVLLLAAMVLPAGAGEIPDCVGAWSLDEGTAKAAADASASKNDGTLTGEPKWEEGKLGKAVSLDGTKDCIALKKELSPILGKTASLSCWVKTKAAGNETFWQAPAIIGVEEAGGGNDIFWGWVDQDGKIGIQAGDAEGAKSSAAITDDKWHHVAFTRNMDSGEVKVYVDGKVAGTATSDTGEKTSAFDAFGRRENTGGDPTFFAGSLDEIRIYKRVLTDAEVATLAKGEK